MNNNETIQQQLMAIREKQERIQQQLSNDAAYQHSIKNDDILNMMLVLEANGEDSTFRDADLQVQWGKTLALIAEYNAIA
tara:strand:- start:874 stop:1113 length:240 start_codon:yes stop_codon:yes gene_type:complete